MKFPIFLISLQKDSARREVLKSLFKSYDEFVLTSAVDGREMSAKEYFAYADTSLKAYGKLLSPAEIGCALSHAKAYEAFLATDAKLALIFEDDVMGDDSKIQKAFEYAKLLPPNGILICGGTDGLEGRFSAFGKCIKRGEISDAKDDTLFEVSPNSYGVIYRATAYILTRKAAKALLETHKKAVCVADLWGYLLKSNKLKMYYADIFAHPLDLTNSNLETERQKRGYKPSFKTYLNSLKFVILSRFDRFILGHERIFKR
ncbi:glycosyltransferase family 25 protein [Campylobacter sp. RM12920]|uniref:Glycosyltransferase family 25 protein n=1 Tax=Campylobacter californiensis TaxID=1032243 RepID=A0ABD4JKL2_9BACT|nr:glycosyltransferase family 25 protein [Campylobacter sp. RM12919]MBE2988554.1 glycosyltransferase family 25 protein [Campylobacter sp. RM12920]